MKKHRLALIGLFAGLSAFAVTSCAYDPYYSATSYSGGYGNGYGYGGSNFSTSFFVSTGNPRWAYDPYAGCYYDYTRRSYYDPYLYGYYPVGYRPRYVVGAPHPHGWSHGGSYCPPPSRIRNHTIDHYGNRAQSYRSLGRDWSRNVTISSPADQQRPSFGGRNYEDRGAYNSRGPAFSNRQNAGPSWGNGRDRGSDGRIDSGRGGLSREIPRESVPRQNFLMNRGEDRANGSADHFPDRQPRQQIDRQAVPPQQRMERSAPPAMRESSPGNGDPGGRSRSEIPAPNAGQRGGMRSLGEG